MRFASRGKTNYRTRETSSPRSEATPDASRPKTKQRAGESTIFSTTISCTRHVSPILIRGVFSAPCITTQGQRGIDFIPVSNGLRAAFVTSHNIYYVKSSIPDRPHRCFCIILYINILCDMNIGVVNNFSTTLTIKWGFGSQARSKDRANQNKTTNQHIVWNEECRKE